MKTTRFGPVWTHVSHHPPRTAQSSRRGWCEWRYLEAVDKAVDFGGFPGLPVKLVFLLDKAIAAPYLMNNRSFSTAMRVGTDTKERIKESALRLFAENGIAETSIRDIAQTAGVSQGAMYNHYGGKDELVWDLFVTNFSEIGQELRHIAHDHQTLDAKLVPMIRYLFELVERDWALVSYVFFARHHMLRKASCTDIMYPYMVFRTVIAEAIKRGEIPQQDPDVAASLVIGAMLQVTDNKMLGPIKQELTDISDNVAAACLRMLKEDG